MKKKLFLTTFKEFPSRQKAASSSIDKVMEKMKATTGSKKQALKHTKRK